MRRAGEVGGVTRAGQYGACEATTSEWREVRVRIPYDVGFVSAGCTISGPPHVSVVSAARRCCITPS